MRKIKSVKLRRELPGCPIGYKQNGDCEKYYFGVNMYLKSLILEHPDFFEIEYEEEKKFVDFRIVADAKWQIPHEKTIESFCEKDMWGKVKVTKLQEGTL